MPEHRGKRISNAVIENFFDRIIDVGYQANRIEILANNIPETRSLYQTFGFQPTILPYFIDGGTSRVPMFRKPLSELPLTTTIEQNRFHFFNILEISRPVTHLDKVV